MAKNRIIAFANQKGGAGKTTLCVMMAHWLAREGCKVLVYDADAQQTLYDHRQDDLKANPGYPIPWEVKKLNALDYNLTVRELETAAKFNGYVLIDAPGALVFPGLVPILQSADIVVIPFAYDYNVMKSTIKFIKALLSDTVGQETKRLFFVPNKIEDNVGTKDEKEQNEKSKADLEKLGTVTFRVKKGVAVQRYSTLSCTEYQMKATMGVWTKITNKLKRL